MSGKGPFVALVLLFAFIGYAPGADAANSSSKGTGITYRWVDEQGVVHYGDRIPPQYAQKEQTVLNNQGVEVRRLDAQKSPQQLAAAALAQEATVRQKQHDAFLMTTYTSVGDIESLRDVRLDQLRGQQVAAQQYIESLYTRLGALQTRARIFRPYSARPEAHRMPDDLAEDLIRTLNELHTQNNVLTAKNDEVTAVNAQFQADIERYRELHSAHVAPQ
ncbi:MAG TPA: DUF4124 domain-containing protein [Steroidobacteraceae bacterium]